MSCVCFLLSCNVWISVSPKPAFRFPERSSLTECFRELASVCNFFSFFPRSRVGLDASANTWVHVIIVQFKVFYKTGKWLDSLISKTRRKWSSFWTIWEWSTVSSATKRRILKVTTPGAVTTLLVLNYVKRSFKVPLFTLFHTYNICRVPKAGRLLGRSKEKLWIDSTSAQTQLWDTWTWRKLLQTRSLPRYRQR